MRRVVLWRHGRTSWNAAGRFQGQTDIDLDETGREQAARAARLLGSLDPVAIISSDLRRAADTAAALAAVTGLSVSYDEGLRETYAGAWQGLTFDEINERFPDEARLWETGDVDVHPGGGESRVEVAERTCTAVGKALVSLPDDGTVVFATHGGAARVALCSLIGLPTSAWGALGGLNNCNWSVLAERDGVWRLVEHNAGTLPEPVMSPEG